MNIFIWWISQKGLQFLCFSIIFFVLNIKIFVCIFCVHHIQFLRHRLLQNHSKAYNNQKEHINCDKRGNQTWKMQAPRNKIYLSKAYILMQLHPHFHSLRFLPSPEIFPWMDIFYMLIKFQHCPCSITTSMLDTCKYLQCWKLFLLQFENQESPTLVGLQI